MVSENSKISQLLAGNWKMNGLRSSLVEIRALARGIADLQGVGEHLLNPDMFSFVFRKKIRFVAVSWLENQGFRCNFQYLVF